MKTAHLRVSGELVAAGLQLPAEITVIGRFPAPNNRDQIWIVQHPGLPVEENNCQLPLVDAVIACEPDGLLSLAGWQLVGWEMNE